MNRTRLMLGSLAACGALFATTTATAAAEAKTVTLHVFSRQVYSELTGPTGAPLGASAASIVGDRIAFANDDYVGNHRHHARRPAYSEHIDCVVTRPTAATCDGVLALGGAMLFADNWTLDLTAQSPPSVIRITAGTNQYRHAHGTIRVTPFGGPNSNNRDETISFTR